MIMKHIVGVLAATALVTACDSGGGDTANPVPGAAANRLPYTAAADVQTIYSSESLSLADPSSDAPASNVGLPAAGPFQWPLTTFSWSAKADGSFEKPEVTTLAFFQQGRWWRLPLGAGSAANATQISAEQSADPICLAQIHALDKRDATRSRVLYSLPGADGTCGTGDDTLRSISLSDGTSTAPTPFAGTGLLLKGVDFYDTQGLSLGALIVVGNRLILADPAMSNARVLGTAAADALPLEIIDADRTQAWVRINNEVRRVDDGGTLGKALYSDTGSQAPTAWAADDEYLYFGASQTNALLGTTFSLYRIAKAGDTAAEMMYASRLTDPAGSITALRVTDSKIFFELYDFFSSDQSTSLLSVGKKVSSALDAAATPLDHSTRFIAFSAVSKNRVYYNLPAPDDLALSAAKVVDEAGTSTAYEHAFWSGPVCPPTQGRLESDLASCTAPLSVVQTRYSSPYDGSAMLVNFRQSDGQALDLGTLKPTGNIHQRIELKQLGPIGLVLDETAAQGQDYHYDVLLLDLEANRVRALTDTPDHDEAPVTPAL